MERGTAKDALRPFLRLFKVLKWLGVLLLVAILLACLIAAILAIWPDIDAVDDSDLAPAVKAGANEEFTGQLIGIANRISKDQEFDSVKFAIMSKLHHIHAGGEAPGELGIFVHANLVLLDELEALMPKLTRWSIPPTKISGMPGEARVEWENSYQELFFLLDFAVHYYRINNESEKCARILKISLQFGSDMLSASNELFDAWMAASYWEGATYLIRHAFGSGLFDRKQSSELIALMSRLHPKRKDLKNCFLGQYQLFKRTVEYWDEHDLPPMGPEDNLEDIPSQYFSPNRTVQMASTTVRRIISSLDNIQYEHHAELGDEFYMQRQQKRGKLDSFFHHLGPNYIGHVIAERNSRAWCVSHGTWHRLAEKTAATQLMLALDLHAAAHGDYPQSLEELVTPMLPELPRDPYDPDSTFQYLKREDGSVDLWSVGPLKAKEIDPAILEKGFTHNRPDHEEIMMTERDFKSWGGTVTIYRLPPKSEPDSNKQ